jgi:polysaccharide biosynthesis/export protein
MKLIKTALLISVFFLTSCQLAPGQHLSASGKNKPTVPDSQFDLNKMVDIYPLTPSVIENLRPAPVKSQINPGLDEQAK